MSGRRSVVRTYRSACLGAHFACRVGRFVFSLRPRRNRRVCFRVACQIFGVVFKTGYLCGDSGNCRFVFDNSVANSCVPVRLYILLRPRRDPAEFRFLVVRVVVTGQPFARYSSHLPCKSGFQPGNVLLRMGMIGRCEGGGFAGNARPCRRDILLSASFNRGSIIT